MDSDGRGHGQSRSLAYSGLCGYAHTTKWNAHTHTHTHSRTHARTRGEVIPVDGTVRRKACKRREAAPYTHGKPRTNRQRCWFGVCHTRAPVHAQMPNGYGEGLGPEGCGQTILLGVMAVEPMALQACLRPGAEVRREPPLQTRTNFWLLMGVLGVPGGRPAGTARGSGRLWEARAGSSAG